LEKDSETFPSFFSKVPFIFDFMTCNDGKQKHVVEKKVNKTMVDERERDKN
jgi:hypothetical protein